MINMPNFIIIAIFLLLLSCRIGETNKAVAYYNIGNVYSIKQDYDKVIEFFKKAIELKPDFTYAHKNMESAYKKKMGKAK